MYRIIYRETSRTWDQESQGTYSSLEKYGNMGTREPEKHGNMGPGNQRPEKHGNRGTRDLSGARS
jgi:hypothetical protein